MDRIAKEGLRYNRVFSTALCSPTRAALITGRNHHSAGFGVISEMSTGFPGYNSVIGKDKATIGRILLDNGSTVTPRLSVGWRHAFGDDKPDADLRFVGGGAGFSTEGVPIAKDAAVVEAGLDLSVGASGKLGVGYSGQLSSENRDHGVVVSFSMGF